VTLIEVYNGDKRTFAKVRDRDVALLAPFQWRMQDGDAITELHDVYELTVSMDYVIAHPSILYGSHSAN
jgi:hypothetical protein